MAARTNSPVSSDSLRLHASRRELVERIARIVREDGTCQPLPGLFLARLSIPVQRLQSVVEPSLFVIAQGQKVVFVGTSRHQYDPFTYLLSTLELPRVSQITEASSEKPYLGLRLVLEPHLVGSVMIEAGHVVLKSNSDVEATNVSPLDPELLDAAVRLVRLVESPGDARLLMPLVKKEIVYRLLVREQSGRLSHLVSSSGYTSPIAKAVERLRRDFDHPIRIKSLAEDLGMSASSFHQHFKSVTAMSPLQFQKRLRLQEARRLMLAGELDASTVAHRVGYSDAAQFSREYKSVFGAPPVRDVQRLRTATNSNEE